MKQMKRILVIDDEAIIRESLKLSLETEDGLEVLTACSGIDGLSIARAERPDAILLDVMMPGMDGLATFQELQADAATRSIPVMFVTGNVELVARHGLAECGAAGVIAKPFSPADLRIRVAGLLAGKA